MTEEQRRLRAELATGLDHTPRAARTESDSETRDATNASSGLGAEEIHAVVARNRPQVQRCYETAARIANFSDTARIDIDLQVGASGSVTHVATRGPQLASLSTCIERTVRSWRFPASQGGGRVSIPVVFQPGRG